MDFKIGQIVEYSGKNYVIMDVQFKNIEGRDRIYVHIKDLDSNDILYVNSKHIRIVSTYEQDVLKLQESDEFEFEDFANKEVKKAADENVILENKTEYLNSLFSQINKEDTFEFFNVDNQTNQTQTETNLNDDLILSNTTNEQFENNQQKTENNLSSKNPTNTLSQNFIAKEKKEEFLPRRKEKKDEILRTEPYFSKNNSLSEEVRANNNSLENLENNNIIKSRREIKEGSILIDDNTDITPSDNFDEDVNFLESDKTIIEPFFENGFSESTDDDITVTSETDRFILGEIKEKAKKYNDNRNRKQILSTRPINPRLVEEHFSKESKDNLFDEVTKEFEQPSEKELDFGIRASDLDKTKTIRNFKTMSNWFIFLVVMSLTFPVLAIVVRLIGNFSTNIGNLTTKNILQFSVSLEINSVSINVVTTFIYTILLLFITPVTIFITVIYSTVYLVMVLRKQYYTLAYVAQDSIEKRETIKLLKEFSDESSVFMLKLHRDNKDSKKQIKKLLRLSGLNIYNVQDGNEKDNSKVIN